MVSIIIPAYNIGSYIDRCVKTLVKQTFKEIEIILINDGSTDDTGMKCAEWAKKDPRVVYIEKKNEGQGIARNIGVNAAQYDYITFVDSDDWCELTYVEKLFNALKKYDADISICNKYGVLIEGERKQQHIIKNWIMPNTRIKVEDDYNLIYKVKFSLGAKMFKKSLFTDNNIQQPNHKFENNTVIPLLVANSEAVCFIEDSLYYYWLNREGSTVNNFKSFFDMKKCLAETKRSFINHNLFYQYYESLLRFSLGNIKHTLKCAASKCIKGSEVEYEQLKNELYHFMDENYPNWINLQDIKIDIWGSYNLRKIVQNIISYPDQIKKHYGFSNIISCMDEGTTESVMPYHQNSYRQQMLAYDFSKEFVMREKAEADYILIDLLEERYDVIKLNGHFYSKSDAFDECEIDSSVTYDILEKYDESYWKMWKTACIKFVEKIKCHYNSNQVILVKTKLSEYYGAYGREYKFHEYEDIGRINVFLEKCYEFILVQLPGVTVLDNTETQYDFTDKDFMFGCIPSHLNEMYFSETAELIIKELCLKKEVDKNVF